MHICTTQGDNDLIVSQGSNPFELKLELNDGGGTFSSSSVIANLLTNSQHCMLLADLDGDSDLDLVIGVFSPVDLRLYRNNGLGTFDSGTALSRHPSGAPYSIAAARINGDSILDLFVANGGAPASLFWLRGLGSGSFSSHNLISTDNDNFQQVAAADMDGGAYARAYCAALATHMAVLVLLLQCKYDLENCSRAPCLSCSIC